MKIVHSMTLKSDQMWKKSMLVLDTRISVLVLYINI